MTHLTSGLRALRVLCGSMALAIPHTSLAQSLESRIAAVNDGALTFHFAGRPGVCGDGENFIRTSQHSYYGNFSEEYLQRPCVEGPVQVRLMVREGEVTRVQTWAGPLRRRDGVDVGAVPAAEAARVLLSVARRHASGNVSNKAILGAVLADSAVVWPTLLTIAHEAMGGKKSARQEAMFWLSRYASGALFGHPNDPFEDDDSDDPDDDLKRHAVFVLSQLPNGEGIPELLEVARSRTASPRVKSQAFFWLGQSGDARALALFETVLKS